MQKSIYLSLLDNVQYTMLLKNVYFISITVNWRNKNCKYKSHTWQATIFI